MPINFKGKINWKFPIIVAILAIVISVGIFIWPGRLLNNLSIKQDNIISGQGTIRWFTVEGGSFGIINDDGVGYDPINLSSEFQEGGLRVKFTAKERNDLGGFHPGTIIEIIKIEKIEEGLRCGTNEYLKQCKRGPCCCSKGALCD